MYIGIDQSLRHTGVAWLLESEVKGYTQIDCDDKRGGERLQYIHHKIRRILKEVKPRGVAIEGYSYGSPGRLADLGELGGVIKLLLTELSIPYIIVTPAQLKKFVTGLGSQKENHAKSGVINGVNAMYGLDLRDPHDNNIADAIGLAAISDAYYMTRKLTVRTQLEVIEALRNPPAKKKRKQRKQLNHKVLV